MATAVKKKKKLATARKRTTRTTATKKSVKKKAAPKKKWSRHVMQTSDALDLESGVFKSKDPAKIARSLKRSAEKSKRRKGTPFQSAMSMLNFYINRAGKHLTTKEKKPLEEAKVELRRVFGKES
ncbi:DUF3175 domain-containing protein [Niastella sp. OAS944]|uniref:DUF3175 domain-containing protein n=1 Tax=Niastella sp. OAS944 TaxID=2664089 RepID=UPI0034996665|nr:hypothetical protein [Chitinophagaceae bacterium OAS944]